MVALIADDSHSSHSSRFRRLYKLFVHPNGVSLAGTRIIQSETQIQRWKTCNLQFKVSERIEFFFKFSKIEYSFFALDAFFGFLWSAAFLRWKMKKTLEFIWLHYDPFEGSSPVLSISGPFKIALSESLNIFSRIEKIWLKHSADQTRDSKSFRDLVTRSPRSQSGRWYR